MGYKLYLTKNKGKNRLTACVQQTQRRWNAALIPKSDGLVAKARQSLSSKVAHYIEPAPQK